jgi:tetratricopeptide (TPR) repeat protein
MNNLALALAYQRKYEEAESMIRKALKLRETKIGREHPATLDSVYRQAFLLAQLRYYPESLDLYERACDGYLISYGDGNPITRECRQYYAMAISQADLSRGER